MAGWMDKLKEATAGLMTEYSKLANKKVMKATMAGIAMVMDANGVVKDEEMETMNNLIMRDPELKCYKYAEMMEVFNEVHDQFKVNKFAGQGVALGYLGKISDQKEARIIIGKVCAIADSDGDFDVNEKASVVKMCGVMPIQASEFGL
ncbi:MAG: TerB family tellurite resistance protein [Spirochaetes bacterium]|nr:TerB family tellurite resistance protein [Spirochaetota bacterium]